MHGDALLFGRPFGSFRPSKERWVSLCETRSYSSNKAGQRTAKLVGEFLLAGAACVLLLPLFLIIAMAVWHSGPGPIVHRRRVVGYGGQSFDAFKFRTMRLDADAVLEADADLKREFSDNFKLTRDPRVTKTGRFLRKYSLDELPQFLNVLRGEMAIVGPRMITPAELLKYGDRSAKLQTVRPGLTGLWQVSGRQTLPYGQRIELDMYYIEHWNLWLDVQILCRTPVVVLRSKGAY
jgi:lipopolysaccharide/colanic/teichoic acid biosynthesis glycosyltransferase